ncbi:MAG: hypothetical protein K0S37_4709 [Microbacterium sp.]|jgi:hypothetical protein|nr:hypothetical protein [Microbacterium sp.]
MTAGVAAVLLAVTLPSAPAFAGGESVDTLSVVESQGLLGQAGALPHVSQEAQQPTPLRRTTVEPGEPSPERVEINPVTDATARYVDRVGATVQDSTSYGFVTGLSSVGANASFVVIKDSTAPDAYDFTVGDASTRLTLNDDGSVTVSAADDTWMNKISAPWAKDANGQSLETSYTVSGNIITQKVELEGAAFPVTADPTTECGVGWCSVYLNRSETRDLANGAPSGITAFTAGCTALGGPWAGVACAAGAGITGGTAAVAYGQGNCVGAVAYLIPPAFLPSWNPFIEPRGTVHCP